MAAATVSATDPTVSFGADKVTIDMATSMSNVQLSAFTGGNCSVSDATLTELSLTSGKALRVEFPIAACDLKMNDEVLFTVGANTADDAAAALSLSFFEYRVTLSPEYTFTINYSYGDVDVVTSNLTDTDMDVKFKLESYNSGYTNASTITSKLAGEPIYLALSVLDTNTTAVFDHTAYNFAVTNCKIYHAGDRSFEYTFFDNERDSCSNTMIDFQITYQAAAHQWRLSHLLFILNNVDGAEQEIECEVKVCHSALSGSACSTAARNCGASF